MLKRDFGINFFIMAIFLSSNILLSETKHRLENDEFGGKIVGGQPVELKKYPFAVQFFNMGALCGGVILNSWTVMTAAHCFENNKDIDSMTVQVGSKFIYDFNAQRHELRSYVIHENYYQKIPFENDIALLFVKEPIKFNDVAKKAILVDHKDWMKNNEENFIVTGWGWQKYGGSVSKVDLLMTKLRYVPIEECSRLHKVTFSEEMFCLYGDGQRDTCKGDSGGGVLWHGRLVGLTSHGDGCAKEGKPSVYINIWYLRDWIKKQVNKFVDSYCRDQQ